MAINLLGQFAVVVGRSVFIASCTRHNSFQASSKQPGSRPPIAGKEMRLGLKESFKQGPQTTQRSKAGGYSSVQNQSGEAENTYQTELSSSGLERVACSETERSNEGIGILSVTLGPNTQMCIDGQGEAMRGQRCHLLTQESLGSHSPQKALRSILCPGGSLSARCGWCRLPNQRHTLPRPEQSAHSAPVHDALSMMRQSMGLFLHPL